MIIPPSMLILNSKRGGITKTGVEKLYDVRKVSIRCILNSEKGNKLIRFLKRNEHKYYEIVSNVPFRVLPYIPKEEKEWCNKRTLLC